MAVISAADRRFRLLLALAGLQDLIVCAAAAVGIARLDTSQATLANGASGVFLVVFTFSAVMLPLSLGLTVWGLIMLRRVRKAGGVIGAVPQLAVLLAQFPIIVVVIFLILLAVTF